jgi:hypothetical protein
MKADDSGVGELQQAMLERKNEELAMLFRELREELMGRRQSTGKTVRSLMLAQESHQLGDHAGSGGLQLARVFT